MNASVPLFFFSTVLVLLLEPFCLLYLRGIWDGTAVMDAKASC